MRRVAQSVQWCYGLDDQRIGFRSLATNGKFHFRHCFQTSSGQHPASSPIGLERQRERGVNLTTHIHLVPKLMKDLESHMPSVTILLETKSGTSFKIRGSIPDMKWEGGGRGTCPHCKLTTPLTRNKVQEKSIYLSYFSNPLCCCPEIISYFTRSVRHTAATKLSDSLCRNSSHFVFTKRILTVTVSWYIEQYKSTKYN